MKNILFMVICLLSTLGMNKSVASDHFVYYHSLTQGELKLYGYRIDLKHYPSFFVEASGGRWQFKHLNAAVGDFQVGGYYRLNNYVAIEPSAGWYLERYRTIVSKSEATHNEYPFSLMLNATLTYKRVALKAGIRYMGYDDQIPEHVYFIKRPRLLSQLSIQIKLWDI